MSGGTLSAAANIQVGGVTSGGLIDPTRTGVEGIFNLSGGTVTTTKINVGQAGDGTLTITGGNLTAGTFRAESHDGYTGVINLTAGTVHADKVIMGLNGTLNLASAATLDTYTNMSFAANGLLVWEGDRSSEVATLAGDGTFAGADGVVDISTLTLGVDYDEAFGTGSELLVYKYDSGADETKVWTVIPEPATLGLVSFVGLATLFVRRRLMM